MNTIKKVPNPKKQFRTYNLAWYEFLFKVYLLEFVKIDATYCTIIGSKVSVCIVKVRVLSKLQMMVRHFDIY